MVLIGFTGKAGSGKTYSAMRLAFLLKELGMDVPVLSFATPIKDKAKKLFDKPTRTDYQAIGDSMRAEDPLSIIKLAEAAAKESVSGIAIFDDVRLNTEVDFIKKCGFIIKMSINDNTRAARLLSRDGHVLTDEEAQHITENEARLAGADFIIDNNGSIFDTDEQIRMFIAKYNFDIKGGDRCQNSKN